MNREIQPSESKWLEEDEQSWNWGMALAQGIVGGLAVMCLFLVLLVQTYKYGQRHPNPAKFCTYAAAIDLANEREAYGRNQSCKSKP